MTLAQQYHQVWFPLDPVLYVNDGSLERGGIFDIYWENKQKGTARTAWWIPPHREHRRGTVIDIRANNAEGAIPVANRAIFEKLVKRLGGNYIHESVGTPNEHYHVRLLGVAE